MDIETQPSQSAFNIADMLRADVDPGTYNVDKVLEGVDRQEQLAIELIGISHTTFLIKTIAGFIAYGEFADTAKAIQNREIIPGILAQLQAIISQSENGIQLLRQQLNLLDIYLSTLTADDNENFEEFANQGPVLNPTGTINDLVQTVRASKTYLSGL